MKNEIIKDLKTRDIDYIAAYLDSLEDLLDIFPACEKITREDIRKWHDEVVEIENEF